MSFAAHFGVRSVLLALLFTLSALAEQSGASLSGVISDGVTGSAIRGARVSLQLLGPENASALAVSDQSGRFSFVNLPPGRYRLIAARQGYERLSYGAGKSTQPGQIVTLVAGEAKQGLDFALPPLSAIAGTVLDEDGDPMMRANVSLLRTFYPRGKPQLTSVRNAMTNDRGEYRLFDVPPGRYFLTAAQDMPRLAAVMRAAAGQPPQQERYGLEYYPNALDPSSASPVILQPGKELHGYDFRLTPQPAVHIKGHVVGPMDHLAEFYGLYLGIAAADSLGQGTFQRGFGAGPPDYAFEIPDIPPGSYIAWGTLSGRDKETGQRVEFAARQRIEVGATGDDDVTLTLQPGIDISGKVRVEGEGAAGQKNLRVMLVSGDEMMARHENYTTQASADGSFTFKDVVPGIWDINVTPIPDGGYIKSMRLGEQDVLTEDMTIGPDSKGPLDIVVSARGATIAGDVDNGGQSEDSRPIVLLAPEGRFSNVFSFYAVAVADENGHFSMKALTPGAYKLFAFDDMERNAYFDPDFLKPFAAKGTPVKLSEGPNPSVKLKLIHTSAAPVNLK